MVGYPESLTDPSYRSQILILTYPLVGNYGIPERPASLQPTDVHLDTLPAAFESSQIHVAALVVGAYHPSFSHYLAKSSLGKWLKEEGVPAIWGVDTRALTKRLREKGVTLGRVLSRKESSFGESQSSEGERGRKIFPSVGPSGLLSLPNRIFGSGNDDKETASASTSPSGLGSSGKDWRNAYNLVPFSDPNLGNLVADVSVKKPILYTPKGVSGVDPSVHPREGRSLRVIAVDVGMKYNQIRCFTKRGVEVKVVPWVSLPIQSPPPSSTRKHEL
jgi:carbamoyl-phosphate synthase/aspartate carbamoyltransferase